MDGENNGSKPYEQMDDLGGFVPLFLVQHPYTPSKVSRATKLTLMADLLVPGVVTKTRDSGPGHNTKYHLGTVRWFSALGKKYTATGIVRYERDIIYYIYMVYMRLDQLLPMVPCSFLKTKIPSASLTSSQVKSLSLPNKCTRIHPAVYSKSTLHSEQWCFAFWTAVMLVIHSGTLISNKFTLW